MKLAKITIDQIKDTLNHLLNKYPDYQETINQLTYLLTDKYAYRVIKVDHDIKGQFCKLDMVYYKIENNRLDNREIIMKKPSVACLLIDDNNFIFVIQNRITKNAICDNIVPGSLEICAGYIEDGESSNEAIIREIREEIGYQLVQEPLFIGSIHKNSGTDTSLENLYLAHIKVDESFKQSLDGNELLDIISIPEKLCYDLLEEGIITDSATVIAIQNYIINKDKY